MTINEFMGYSIDINPYVSIYNMTTTVRPTVWFGRYDNMPKEYNELEVYSFNTFVSDSDEPVIEFNVDID